MKSQAHEADLTEIAVQKFLRSLKREVEERANEHPAKIYGESMAGPAAANEEVQMGVLEKRQSPLEQKPTCSIPLVD